jgi:4-alpha-glucanotransferase
MILSFRIHYRTAWGQQIRLSGNVPALGSQQLEAAPSMRYESGDFWTFDLELPQDAEGLTYRYWLIDPGKGWSEAEAGPERYILLSGASEDARFEIRDQWRSAWDAETVEYSAAFRRALMPPGAESQPSFPARSGRSFRFQIHAPRVLPGHQIAVSGSLPSLGEWGQSEPLPLQAFAQCWMGQIALPEGIRGFSYKYVIWDPARKEIQAWETGLNREASLPAAAEAPLVQVQGDEKFRYPSGLWRGAGVGIPVFSLRSCQSAGVGELADLPLLVDWANQAGLQLVQILPINDTVVFHTWQDSYPYSGISVYALHPIYLRPEDMGLLDDEAEMASYRARREVLNQLPELDYEAVMELKSRYFKHLFDQDQMAFAENPDYQAFFEENKGWLLPYAAFSYLRDLNGTADFSQWKDYSSFDLEAIEELTSPQQAHYEHIAIHYFIQYHLHLQLTKAVEYARSRGVALKGDIPIGISRHSVDAWVAPHLYHMDAQAGAPPDAFAVAGQNWRFPTYNWKAMAQDGYAWWRSRMTHMSRYFDAYRIDHILGFFRIWEIPAYQVQGILGRFNPSLPLTRQELINRGLWLDYDRFCKPYIREHLLEAFFGPHAQEAAERFLVPKGYGIYDLKPFVATQRQAEAWIDEAIRQEPEAAAKWERLREGLYGLIAEVIFLPVPGRQEEGFSPRIALHFTHSYRELDDRSKAALNEIYTDFFFRRHEGFWREQALVKLPAIKNAADMLVCGEDLGMVPASVPGVMRQLGILSLEIQRMPKQSDRQFFHPADAPYLSVVSTSTHDMSTLRGWWEEDRQATQRFYSQMLGRQGGAPFFCEPWVARDVLAQHLYSPAMWAIFPLQDLLAMDGALRRISPQEEQINVPANPTHYWRYRMHLSLEELIEARSFSEALRQLVQDAGRLSAY